MNNMKRERDREIKREGEREREIGAENMRVQI